MREPFYRLLSENVANHYIYLYIFITNITRTEYLSFVDVATLYVATTDHISEHGTSELQRLQNNCAPPSALSSISSSNSIVLRCGIMSGDIIPEEALQVIYSLIDEITCEIILNIDHRLQKFEALQVG